MSAIAIFQPVLALITLTAAVWLVMVVNRVRQLRRPDYWNSDSDTLKKPEDAVARRARLSSSNFANLLELPTLFYVLVFIIVHLALVDSLYVWLAWVFVIFRILHSLVHCTRNNLRYRFRLWLISAIALWSMLARVLFVAF